MTYVCQTEDVVDALQDVILHPVGACSDCDDARRIVTEYRVSRADSLLQTVATKVADLREDVERLSARVEVLIRDA